MPYPEGVVSPWTQSVPYIAFVPRFAMLFQQHAELILKTLLFVMLVLFGDVIAYGFQIGDTHRKHSVTGLPGEIPRLRITLFDPD